MPCPSITPKCFMKNYLTTAKYLNGIRCCKRLWYEENVQQNAAPTSLSQQRIFEQHAEVKTRAYHQFPEGLHIGRENLDLALQQTENAINSGEQCLFDAAFCLNGTFIRCDILQKDENGWRIIEVRASKRVKKDYCLSLALLKYVLAEQGIPISATELMLLNGESVYPDLFNLFVIVDVTGKVNLIQNDVSYRLQVFKTTLDRDVAPEVLIGKNLCNQPRKCPFKARCWTGIPKNSVFTIPRIKDPDATSLAESGIFRLSELPIDYSLTPSQNIYVSSVLANEPAIDKAAIRQELAYLQYPIHFLDFEADRPAIPRFNDFTPYQEFPFQYSCHVRQSDGEIKHHEYLHTDPTDPSLPLLKSLLGDISDSGSVVVYNARFERGILKRLAELFPEHAAALQSIIARLWDQMVILRKHYEHPDFCGSRSLKVVLPVLVPWLSYEDLDIQEGADAPAAWNLMLNTNSESEKRMWIEHLREYCKMDTLAMVEIHKVLLAL